jgi:hypothetical protein
MGYFNSLIRKYQSGEEVQPTQPTPLEEELVQHSPELQTGGSNIDLGAGKDTGSSIMDKLIQLDDLQNKQDPEVVRKALEKMMKENPESMQMIIAMLQQMSGQAADSTATSPTPLSPPMTTPGTPATPAPPDSIQKMQKGGPIGNNGSPMLRNALRTLVVKNK